MKSIQILGDVFKTDGLVANSVDLDQTPRSAASDLVYTVCACLPHY